MTLPESSSSIDTYSDSAGDHENLPPFNNSNTHQTFQQIVKQPVKPIKSLEQPLPPRSQNFPDTQLQQKD